MYTELTLDELQNVVGGYDCPVVLAIYNESGDSVGYYDYCNQECVAL